MLLSSQVVEQEYIHEVDLHIFLKNLFRTKRKNLRFHVCQNDEKWSQKAFSVNQMDKAVSYIQQTNRKDIYVTHNLYNGSRTIQDVEEFNSLILDFDFYKTNRFEDSSFKDVLGSLEKKLEELNIPYPNVIIDSGRGMYAVWLLKYTPKLTLKKRDVIIRILHEMLKEFGSDHKSLDAAHVFRLPGTINRKTNREVVAYFNLVERHTLAGLGRTLPSLWDVWKKKDNIKTYPDKKKTKKQLATIRPIHKERTLAYDYIYHFVFRLVDIRNGECEGYREYMCFLVRNYYHTMHRKRFDEGDETLYEESLALAYELNQRFTKSLSLKELQTNTLNKNKLYRYKVETLYEKLDVSDEEALRLKVKSKRIVREKDKLRKREERGSVSREEYLEQQSKYTNKQLEYLNRLLADNPKIKNKEIAECMGVHISTVKRLKQQLK